MTFGEWTITTPFGISLNYNPDLSLVATDTNNVFVSFLNYDSGYHEFSKSINGASSWSARKQVSATYEDSWTSEKSIWVDPDNTDYILITYVDADSDDVMLAVSIDGGANFSLKTIDNSGYCWSPCIDVYNDGGTKYIFVLYGREIPFPQKLMMAYSSNDGDSWTLKQVESVAPEDVAGDKVIKAVSASTIYVMCKMYLSSPRWLAFMKTTNSGDSWASSVVSNDANDFGYSHSMAIYDANTVFVTWIRNGTPDNLMFGISTNAGASFTTSTILNANVWGLSMDFVNANTILISYMTGTSLNLIYTIDQGVNWIPIADIDTGTFPQKVTSLSIVSNTIYIFYTGESYYGKIAKCSISTSLPISSILFLDEEPIILI